MAVSQRFRRQGVILLLLCLLPAGAYVAERLAMAFRAQRYADIADQRCTNTLHEAQRGFASLETALNVAGLSAAADTGVVAYLTGARPDRAGLFERLGPRAEAADIGLEVYDRYGMCVAWAGRSGPDHTAEVEHALAGKRGSGVERTPLFAELFCVVPVSPDSTPIGAVLARRVLGVNYPFTNRILTRAGIDEQLSTRLGVPVEFRFAGDQEPWGLTRKRTAPLYNSDSVIVGQVSVGCPDDETLADETHQEFALVRALALLPLLCAGLYVLWNRLRNISPLFLRIFLLTAVVWGVRALLLLLGITESLSPAMLLDRSLYATSIFWGLVRSPADLLLTGTALLLNTLLPLAWIDPRPAQRTSLPARIIPWFVLAAALVGLPRLMGIVATSVVMDSTVNFSDPTLLLPGAGQLLLTLSALLFSLSALVLASCAFTGLLRAAGGLSGTGAWFSIAVLVAAVSEGVVAALFGADVPRGAAALLSLGASALGFVRLRSVDTRFPSGIRILSAVLLSGVFLHLYVSADAMGKDRQRIEAMAAEVVRPVDSWFRGVVADGLKGFEADAVLGVLDQGDPEETRRIAFTVWAHSLACREGYASLFAVTDAGGQIISRFAIGGQSFRISDDDLPDLPGGEVAMREVGSGIGAVRMYAGAIPLRDAGGNVLGFGRVLIAAARQTLFRGETPPILRSTSREGLESFHREVSLAEYRDGALVPSEGSRLPLGSLLAPEIPALLDVSPQHGVWLTERLEGRELETYYLRGGEERSRIVALSMERPGFQWHVAALLRILAGCLLLFLLSGGFLLLRFWVSGGKVMIRFRHRLLGAFLLLSVLPMAGVVYYAQWFAGERLVRRTTQELSTETRDIVDRVAPLLGGGIDRRPAVDRDVERIAVDRDTDFNLYLGEELLSSSAPTLYEAGILDRRLNAEAYRSVVLGGHPFVMLTERIGEYRFAVGYRAVVDSVGTVLAVIGVPTVFRQEELDNEIAGTATFIAGLAIVLLVIVVVAATAIARTIAAPIQALTEATAKVARGDLDAVVGLERTGGEVGVLVRSFERMTHELKTSRDALIRYERELAWKDMAKQVAHEINNPLTPMKLLLQHLGRAYRDGAEDFGALLDRVLRTVIGQIDQLGRIASEFSHFARMPKRVLEPSSLADIINEVVDLYSKEPQVHFSIQVAPSLPAVTVDRDELHRALINVIRNGVQAMNGEGKIEIRAAVVGTGISLEVTDHGPGMPEEVRLRAFEAGFTTKRGGAGVGLGLVKSTMDELGGTVTLASAPGKGTTVTLWIPTGSPTEGGAQP